MANVVIFGTRDTALLARRYLDRDSPHEAVAFTVHRQYRQSPTLDGLPVIDYENLVAELPPEQVQAFVPMTAREMNFARRRLYEEFKALGYTLVSYVSSRAFVMDAQIGENCFILEANVIQDLVHIGNNVVAWSGNHIGHHSQIQDHVFLTSHCVIGGHAVVGAHSFLSANCTVLDQRTLAEGAFVVAGSTVTRDMPPWSVCRGNPARVLRSDSRRLAERLWSR